MLPQKTDEHIRHETFARRLPDSNPRTRSGSRAPFFMRIRARRYCAACGAQVQGAECPFCGAVRQVPL